MAGKHKYIDMVLILVTIIWGLKPTVIKVGLQYTNSLNYNVLRLLVGALAAWSILLLKREYRHVERSDYKKIGLISVFGFFVFQYFYGLGIGKTTAGNTSVIMGTLPLMVGVINHLFGFEKMTRLGVIGILVSLTGMAIVIFNGGEIGLTPDNLMGNLFIFICTIGYAVYMVFSKPIGRKYPSRQITAMAITITTILTIALSGFDAGDIKFTTPLVISLLYSGIIAMYLGNFIWMWAIKRSSSTRVSMYNNLTPIFSIISSSIILKEGFTWPQIIGTMIIFLGLYISSFRKLAVDRG